MQGFPVDSPWILEILDKVLDAYDLHDYTTQFLLICSVLVEFDIVHKLFEV